MVVSAKKSKTCSFNNDLNSEIVKYLNIDEKIILHMASKKYKKFLEKDIIGNRLGNYLSLLKLVKKKPILPNTSILYGRLCGSELFTTPTYKNKIIRRYEMSKIIYKLLRGTQGYDYYYSKSLLIDENFTSDVHEFYINHLEFLKEIEDLQLPPGTPFLDSLGRLTSVPLAPPALTASQVGQSAHAAAASASSSSAAAAAAAASSSVPVPAVDPEDLSAKITAISQDA